MPYGKFITFEGPEGSGKSTHIRLLATYLSEQGIGVTLTREPGGTPLGEAVRNLLQHNGSGESPVARAEVLLFLASRAQHVQGLIRPALEAGSWVLCDRFEDSTLAYQGYGRGFDLNELHALNRFATHGLRPDLTVLLDITPETSRARLLSRQSLTVTSPDRIESEADDFHIRLRTGFLSLARREPKRFVLVASDRDQDVVAAEVRSAVIQRLMGCGDAD
jgi:dTMP kinase